MLAFQKNRGLRIDHILVSEALKPQVSSCGIDKLPRKNERPSDHAPVVLGIDRGGGGGGGGGWVGGGGGWGWGVGGGGGGGGGGWGGGGGGGGVGGVGWGGGGGG